MNYIILFAAIILFCCSPVQKNSKIAKKSNLVIQGTPSKKITGQQEVEIKKKAELARGFMTGPKSQEGIQYRADSCTFHYEKGISQMDNESSEFKFEKVSLNITGYDETGEEASFERVTYSNVDLIEVYKDWDFTKDFGPIPLDNSAKYGNNSKEATLEFIKKDEGANMIFRHAWIFEEGDSSFFRKGEMRKYETVLNFSKFNKIEMLLKSANIKIFNGDSKSGQMSMNVDCLNFKKLNE